MGWRNASPPPRLLEDRGGAEVSEFLLMPRVPLSDWAEWINGHNAGEKGTFPRRVGMGTRARLSPAPRGYLARTASAMENVIISACSRSSVMLASVSRLPPPRLPVVQGWCGECRVILLARPPAVRFGVNVEKSGSVRGSVRSFTVRKKLSRTNFRGKCRCFFGSHYNPRHRRLPSTRAARHPQDGRRPLDVHTTSIAPVA